MNEKQIKRMLRFSRFNEYYFLMFYIISYKNVTNKFPFLPRNVVFTKVAAQVRHGIQRLNNVKVRVFS